MARDPGCMLDSLTRQHAMLPGTLRLISWFVFIKVLFMVGVCIWIVFGKEPGLLFLAVPYTAFWYVVSCAIKSTGDFCEDTIAALGVMRRQISDMKPESDHDA